MSISVRKPQALGGKLVESPICNCGSRQSIRPFGECLARPCFFESAHHVKSWVLLVCAERENEKAKVHAKAAREAAAFFER